MPTRSTTRSPSPIPRCSRGRGRWPCAFHRVTDETAPARVSVPVRGRRGERRVRARSEDVVSRAVGGGDAPAEWKDEPPRRRGRRRRRRGRSSACRTASRISRASSCPTAEAPTTGWASTSATSSRRQAAASSSIRPTGCCRCRSGPRSRRRPAIRPSAATTTRPRTASSPACRVRCMCRATCRSCSHPATSSPLHERMSWRIIPLDGRAHLPDSMRLWQGDSVGPLGGRHAGRRHHQPERQGVAQRGRRDRQPRRARRGAVHPARRGHDSLRGDRYATRSSTRARGRLRFRSSARRARCSRWRVSKATTTCST